MRLARPRYPVKLYLSIDQRGRTDLNRMKAGLIDPLIELALEIVKGKKTSSSTLYSGHGDALDRRGLFPIRNVERLTKIQANRGRETLLVCHNDVLLGQFGPQLLRGLLPLSAHHSNFFHNQVPGRN